MPWSIGGQIHTFGWHCTGTNSLHTPPGLAQLQCFVGYDGVKPASQNSGIFEPCGATATKNVPPTTVPTEHCNSDTFRVSETVNTAAQDSVLRN